MFTGITQPDRNLTVSTSILVICYVLWELASKYLALFPSEINTAYLALYCFLIARRVFQKDKVIKILLTFALGQLCLCVSSIMLLKKAGIDFDTKATITELAAHSYAHFFSVVLIVLANIMLLIHPLIDFKKYKFKKLIS